MTLLRLGEIGNDISRNRLVEVENDITVSEPSTFFSMFPFTRFSFPLSRQTS